MELASLLAIRPYLYHVTAADNVHGIHTTGELRAAEVLLEEFGRSSEVASRRCGPTQLTSNGRTVELRDQDPLYRKNIAFAENFSFEDLLRLLGGRVYFWPGKANGPIDYGQRHYGRYKSTDPPPVILRIPFADLLESNPDRTPRLCAFNSGSPRWSHGRPSPRGPETFVIPERFPRTASKVVEVTFIERIVLPSSTELGRTPYGPWQLLASA